MIPETEKPQEAKSVYPGKPARHAQANLGRYVYAESTTLFLSRDSSYVLFAAFWKPLENINILPLIATGFRI